MTLRAAGLWFAWMLSACVAAIPAIGRAAAFEFWYAHGGLYAQTINELCAGFNKTYPQDHVRCLPQGTYEQTMRKAVAAYRADQQPAVVEIYDIGTADMMRSGAIYPVDALMKDTGHPTDDADYLDSIRRFYATPDGRLLSQPFGTSTLVLYANRKKLAAAGINELPQTWEAFGQALQALKAHGESCPAVADYTPWKMLEQINAVQGAPIASANNGHDGLAARYDFADGIHLRYMRDVLRWHAQGLLLPAILTHANDQTLAFADGECAMVIDATGAYAIVAKAGMVDAEVGPLPVYAGTTRYGNTIGGSSLWVFKGETPAVYSAVARFLAYLREPQQQLFFSARTGYLPLTHNAEQKLASSPSTEPDAIRVGLASMALPGNPYNAGVRLGFMSLFRLIWQEEVQRALAGRESMDDALINAQARGNLLLERFQATYRASTAGAP
ncbi:extracellular solute-binding protein [Dyella nitratireducens]|uniref:sn-glycerol-3-phosphate-binding periplasmic protein UgpB n=1 Tax=Dyella nitratireducens TaxID=1849580 RepID=A0ABQ1GA72_9GAMM|nr:extracellular solute-binding protein [Dyella nitratireducens]GGA39690.1 glycerol-3-phosphate ABC transporter substrate-binding protein [Dyella nitratireducens]GLQ40472.1 glycerol-3-phosphate ABC transporter substrate-binding protein [Dyella nitratireducens]